MPVAPWVAVQPEILPRRAAPGGRTRHAAPAPAGVCPAAPRADRSAPAGASRHARRRDRVHRAAPAARAACEPHPARPRRPRFAGSENAGACRGNHPRGRARIAPASVAAWRMASPAPARIVAWRRSAPAAIPAAESAARR